MTPNRMETIRIGWGRKRREAREGGERQGEGRGMRALRALRLGFGGMRALSPFYPGAKVSEAI